MINYNPQKAIEILNESGWTRKLGAQWVTNKKGEIFEFEFLIAPGGDRIYTTFQEDLKNVGIKNIFDVHYKTFGSALSASGRNFILSLHAKF